MRAAGGLGRQTTFVERFLSPVSEVSLSTDFTEITDNRNVSLWNSYALVLDEMGRATKADVDIVKNVITADRLTRRVLGSNHHVEIEDCATLTCPATAQLVPNPGWAEARKRQRPDPGIEP